MSLGRTSGGYDIKTDPELFAFSSTSSTTLSSFLSMNEPGGIYGILADKRYEYVITRRVDNELEILDKNLSFLTANYVHLPIIPQAVTCDGKKIYILGKNAPVIYEITW